MEHLLSWVKHFPEDGALPVLEGYSFEAFELAKEFLKPYIGIDDQANLTYYKLLLGYPVTEEVIMEEVDRCERTYDQ